MLLPTFIDSSDSWVQPAPMVQVESSRTAGDGRAKKLNTLEVPLSGTPIVNACIARGGMKDVAVDTLIGGSRSATVEIDCVDGTSIKVILR